MYLIVDKKDSQVFASAKSLIECRAITGQQGTKKEWGKVYMTKDYEYWHIDAAKEHGLKY